MKLNSLSISLITLLVFSCSRDPKHTNTSLDIEKNLPDREVVEASASDIFRMFDESTSKYLQEIKQMDWNQGEEILFNQYEVLLKAQKALAVQPLNKNPNVMTLNKEFPCYDWICDNAFCEVSIDFGFIRTSLSLNTDNNFTRFLDTQCSYYAIDSIEYRYSSQYLIDESNIYSNTGDFGYLEQLRVLDSLMFHSHAGKNVLSVSWSETCENLFSLDYPFWYDLDTVVGELDSLSRISWKTNQKSFLVELSVVRKNIEKLSQSKPQYFNNRSGLVYD
jgi:hypothetical protein